MENRKAVNSYVAQVINSIGVGKVSEWTKKQLNASFGVRNDIVKEIKDNFMKKDVFDDVKINERFLDFCNAIRVLLIVYNYGDLDITKLDAKSAEQIKGADRGSEEEDKQLILSGVIKILNYVKENGFSITPYLKQEEINNIFAIQYQKENWPIIPITFSAMTVLVTLIYFRRAIGRKNLFSVEDLIVDGVNYHVLMVETVTKILHRVYSYASEGKNGRFMGWGFTLDSSFSQAATLSDTYAVVDAINRFSEAFDSDDNEKKDASFLNEINECNERLYGNSESKNPEHFVERCVSSIYKTSLNLYKRTQKVYGAGVFFEDTSKLDGKIQYNYYLTDYNQIASSIRSSALFNPLYVALITLYGYSDKEVVISRFMDDPALVKSYFYNKNDGSSNENGSSNEDGGINEKLPLNEDLVAYAKELSNYEREDFLNWVQKLIDCAPSSNNYGSANSWTDLHKAARVFQKYLETKHPEDLMKINEYRNYLNATRDAIDQVQVMYRNFYNGQRYGVVDTDYLVFSDLDIKTNDALHISRLNKASIGTNNLRPVLLSARILIVNALVKYPNADVSDMYQAIIESRHRPSEKRSSKKVQEIEQKWLWNEDVVDMNSTCRHCEVIMYDYFDYYDKYELGLKMLNLLKNKRVGSEDRVVNGEKIDQFIIREDGSLASTQQAEAFENLVLELTKRNVDITKEIYDKRLKTLELQHLQEKEKLQSEIDALNQKVEEKEQKIQDALREKSEKVEEIKGGSSYQMGETLKHWIQTEMESNLVEMMSMLALKQINFGFDDFSTLSAVEDTLYDAEQQDIKNYLDKIGKEYREDREQATQKYDAYAEKVTSYQTLINMAMDGIFKLGKFDAKRREGGKQDARLIDSRNKELRAIYKEIKTALSERDNALINGTKASGSETPDQKDPD